MPQVTVTPPSIGIRAFFVFKEPFASYVKAYLTVSEDAVSLGVVGVVDMEEMFSMNAVDPYQTVYQPAGVSEYDYKDDYINSVPIITFKYASPAGAVKFIRVPLTYILRYDDVESVSYVNKAIIIDLGFLPVEFDTTIVFNDVADTIASMLGVTPEIKEVSTGDIESVTFDDHALKQTIINNSRTVFKTNSVKLRELELAHSQVLNRLQILGIVLG